MLLLEGSSIKYDVLEKRLLNIELLQVHDRERIGLVGRNGSGKTTLLKILAGELTPRTGNLQSYTSVKYVSQIKDTNLNMSGGEITQDYLQRALNERAGLLLLDEPTTHLDTERILWLEKSLSKYQGAFVVVSHDRAFLDELCTEIWELNQGKLAVYKGNYSNYASQKSIERREQEAAYEKYEKEKARLEKAIRQKEEQAQRATRKPKNASPSDMRVPGVQTHVANVQKKLRKTVKAFEARLGRLDEVKKPEELAPIKMNILHETELRNRVIIRGEQVHGKIAGKKLWRPFNFFVRSGEKVAIIGPNGSGKTTFIKKLLRKERGFTISTAVKIGYFAQNLTILEEDKSILENIKQTSKQNETLIRTVLARMHFRRDDVYKKVSVLSGGEKVKVALAKIFLSDVNVLVLDEPTNFLDIESLEALEALMKDYEGTIIFVTHDRMLVKNVATKIFEIENEQVHVFDGTFVEYENWKNRAKKDEKEDELLLIETKISEVLAKLSIEPSEELEEEFQQLLKEKQKLLDKQ